MKPASDLVGGLRRSSRLNVSPAGSSASRNLTGQLIPETMIAAPATPDHPCFRSSKL